MPQYLNWEKGEVVLSNSEVYNLAIGANAPKRVELTDFSEFDQSKIRSYCKSNFERLVTDLFDRYCHTFQDQYSNSKEKNILIHSTIKQIKAILENGLLVSGELAVGFFWNRVFTIEELMTIRNYFTEHIVKGIPIDYCIFQREDSPYKFKGDHLVVQAESLWRFKDYLLTLHKQVERKNQEEIAMAVMNKKGLFKEEDMEIFVDELSFHFFCFVLTEFLDDIKPSCKAVSFVYFQINRKGYLKKPMFHNAFIKYLIDRFRYPIECIKLREEQNLPWEKKFAELRRGFFDEN